MGNSASSFVSSRQAQQARERLSEDLAQERLSGGLSSARDRDNSDLGHSPRKRGRFSSIRDVFRSKNERHRSNSRSPSSLSRKQRLRSRVVEDRTSRSTALFSPLLNQPGQRPLGQHETSWLPDPLENVSVPTDNVAPALSSSNDNILPHLTSSVTDTGSYPLAEPIIADEPESLPPQILEDDSALPSQLLDAPDAAQTHPRAPNLNSDSTVVPEIQSDTSARTGSQTDDQASILARLLSVAAAATAASLIGSHQRHNLRDARTFSGHSVAQQSRESEAAGSDSSTSQDYVDGSFDGFLSALQNGRLAQALRGNAAGGGGGDLPEVSEPSQASLNFFRMFRFREEFNALASNVDTNNVRMVPIIIVGIRSVAPGALPNQPGEALPPFFGALQAMDSANMDNPTQTLAGSNGDGIDTPLASAVATSNSDTELITDVDNSQVQLQSDVDTTVTLTGASAFETASRLLHTPSPATPDIAPDASSNASISRGSNDRSQPSIIESVLDRLRSLRADHVAPNNDSTDEIPRRRSRRPAWRPFSSAQASTDADGPSRANAGTFLVYVLGGTYPENHPILTTPSLFTDTPSYEDMLMLTNMIGPANPQIADSQDLDSAGMCYDVQADAPELDSRCQICLTNYEVGNSCRQLGTCNHLFHQECIDEWLTTGRNNCPMCRANTAARVKPVDGTINASPVNDSTNPLNVATNAESTVQ